MMKNIIEAKAEAAPAPVGGHTPGPWVISPHVQRLASNALYQNVETTHGGMPICRVIGSADVMDPEAQTNARLIAAATLREQPTS